MVSEKFFDDFLGTSLDTASWTGFNSYSIASSEIFFPTAGSGYITTNGKKTFTIVSEIQIEGYLRDNGASYDSACALFDVSNPSNSIQFGQTDYSAMGIYSYGGGIFSLPQVGAGNGTTAKKYYRLELSLTTLKIYFGDNPGNATLVQTRTLPASVAGKTFYLQVSGGGNPYGGGYWDSVKLFTDLVVSASNVLPSVPFIPSVPSVAS